MQPATLDRNIFQRVLGICATKRPSDEGCWTFENGKITVELERAPELAKRNGAVRLEKKNFPDRVLVIRGDDDQYYAFRNRCAHMKRRMDPVPGSGNVQCCSVNKSTFDYAGKKVFGPAKGDVTTYPVTEKDGTLLITL